MTSQTIFGFFLYGTTFAVFVIVLAGDQSQIGDRRWHK